MDLQYHEGCCIKDCGDVGPVVLLKVWHDGLVCNIAICAACLLEHRDFLIRQQ